MSAPYAAGPSTNTQHSVLLNRASNTHNGNPTGGGRGRGRGGGVDFPSKTTVDEREAVDKLGLQLPMGAHISFLEAYATHLHSRFHNSTYPELLARGTLVEIVLL